MVIRETIEAFEAEKARKNRYSCVELASALDLPMLNIDAVRDYGDLAHHMDLPRSKKG